MKLKGEWDKHSPVVFLVPFVGTVTAGFFGFFLRFFRRPAFVVAAADAKPTGTERLAEGEAALTDPAGSSKPLTRTPADDSYIKRGT